MDHQLINKALHTLLDTEDLLRTPEVIQGIARFICEAAGAPIESTTPMQRAHVELHAAAALLTTEFGYHDHRTYLSLRSDQNPRLSVHITCNDEITVMGWGTSAEEVLDRLRRDATTRPENEAFA